ncbi:HHR096Cp [Eremothecium sinecaudum]|uniref:HHR096Cp n=1 Tax=Eremothecium sinecaudum TaxID=45286 RepID=A0A0X8HWS6_9SACH|nr:HHR096Cp [Eremothecium sinecaudum]AMD22865.1 HHR096Cp [Eremothecium sinecaudum]
MSDSAELRKKRLVGQLKGKLWYCIEQQLRSDLPNGTAFTPKFINALVELCFTQLVDLGSDLEAFARHAGRSTIVGDDLMLRLRKNPELQALLRAELEQSRLEAKTRSALRHK